VVLPHPAVRRHHAVLVAAGPRICAFLTIRR
jgi:hypothetical protein